MEKLEINNDELEKKLRGLPFVIDCTQKNRDAIIHVFDCKIFISQEVEDRYPDLLLQVFMYDYKQIALSSIWNFSNIKPGTDIQDWYCDADNCMSFEDLRDHLHRTVQSLLDNEPLTQYQKSMSKKKKKEVIDMTFRISSRSLLERLLQLPFVIDCKCKLLDKEKLAIQYELSTYVEGIGERYPNLKLLVLASTVTMTIGVRWVVYGPDDTILATYVDDLDSNQAMSTDHLMERIQTTVDRLVVGDELSKFFPPFTIMDQIERDLGGSGIHCPVDLSYFHRQGDQ